MTVHQRYLASEENPCPHCKDAGAPTVLDPNGNWYHHSPGDPYTLFACTALTESKLLEQKDAELAEAEAKFIRAYHQYNTQQANTQAPAESEGTTNPKEDPALRKIIAERDRLAGELAQANIKIAHLDKTLETSIVSMGVHSEDRDKLKHENRRLAGELGAARARIEGIKLRLHIAEGHNQHFERCESAWCHPTPDSDPAMEMRTAQEALKEREG